MDVKSAFLHGYFKEEIYMEQPPSYVQNDSSLVFCLKKYLYDLNQSPYALSLSTQILLLVAFHTLCGIGSVLCFYWVSHYMKIPLVAESDPTDSDV